jgi:glycosyltransferase involved in cell wall biosynthesis
VHTVVLIPTFNEAPTLEAVVREAARFTDSQIVVNDGSTDASGALLAKLCEDLPSLQVIELPSNQGMARAVKHGFERIVGRLDPDDAVVLMDADGQHLAEEIPTLVRRLDEGGLDLVIGRRDLTVYPFYKRFGNAVLSLYGRLLTGFPFRDIECGFKVLRAGALPVILGYYSGYRYSCAQEIAVISVRKNLAIANDCPVSVPFYRRGARLRDVFPILLYSLRAVIKTKK